MQIDCEVVDTRLIYVSNKAVPQHMKTQGNNTSYDQHTNHRNKIRKGKLNRNNEKAKAYKPYFIQNKFLKPGDNSSFELPDNFR